MKLVANRVMIGQCKRSIESCRANVAFGFVCFSPLILLNCKKNVNKVHIAWKKKSEEKLDKFEEMS